MVEEEELDRIRAQVVANNVYEQDSMFFQAMQLGTLETVGLSYVDKSKYLEKIQAVTPEQIRAVAQKYLIKKHLTVCPTTRA